MLIWGTKPTGEKLGYVAEFCPVCRQIQPFLIAKIRITAHLYFISVGKDKAKWHVGTCQNCGADIMVDSEHYTRDLIGNKLSML